MHIAIDARELGEKPTGVGTYLRHLLDEWSRMPSAASHRWTLYAPGRNGAEKGARPRDKSVTGGARSFDRRIVPGRGGTWWEQRALAAAVRRDRPDVLFAPGYTAPLSVGVPIVLTVHDLSFFAHPEWFGTREGMRRRLLTRWSARKARTILTVSEFSKREMVRWLHVPDARVRVVRHGIDRPAGSTTPQAPAPAQDGSRDAAFLSALASAKVGTEFRPPVVLYVGSIFNRRHVPDLIRAFASVLAKVPDARLEIVGDNRTHPSQDLEALATSIGASQRVTLRSYVSDQELASLYNQARVFAFLSEYEGFGFTPLEALARSVPIVVLDTPVAHEVYDSAAVYVPAGDVAATTDALTRLLLDADLRARQLEQAPAVLARYCWPEAARLTLEAIEQAGADG